MGAEALAPAVAALLARRGPRPARPRPDRRRLRPRLLHGPPLLARLRPRPRPGGRRPPRPGSDLRGGHRGDSCAAGRRLPPRRPAGRGPPATPAERGPRRLSRNASPARPPALEADRDGVPAIDLGVRAGAPLAPAAASLAGTRPAGEPGALVYGRPRPPRSASARGRPDERARRDADGAGRPPGRPRRGRGAGADLLPGPVEEGVLRLGGRGRPPVQPGRARARRGPRGLRLLRLRRGRDPRQQDRRRPPSTAAGASPGS